MYIVIPVLVSTLALALPAQAQVYRCDTAQGVVFTDAECDSPAEQTRIDLPPAPRRAPTRDGSAVPAPRPTPAARPAERAHGEPLFDASDCAKATREFEVARDAKGADRAAKGAYEDVRRLKCSTRERAGNVDKQACERAVRQYLVSATATIKRDPVEVRRLRSAMSAACGQ